MTYDKTLGARIKEHRKALGYSQTEFGVALADRMLGWGKQSAQMVVSRIELGQRPLRVSELRAVCEVLGMSVDELLRTDAEPLDNQTLADARLGRHVRSFLAGDAQ